MKVRLYVILKFIYQLKKSQYLAQTSNDVSTGKGSTTDLLGIIIFFTLLHLGQSLDKCSLWLWVRFLCLVNWNLCHDFPPPDSGQKPLPNFYPNFINGN